MPFPYTESSVRVYNLLCIDRHVCSGAHVLLCIIKRAPLNNTSDGRRGSSRGKRERERERVCPWPQFTVIFFSYEIVIFTTPFRSYFRFTALHSQQINLHKIGLSQKLKTLVSGRKSAVFPFFSFSRARGKRRQTKAKKSSN